jgi:rare lipoprotein A
MKYSLIILITLISLLPNYASAKSHSTQNHVQKTNQVKPALKHTVIKKFSKKTKKVEKKTNKLVGVASWYGYESVKKHKPKTANGDVFLPSKMTAAHRSLPFGTKVKVTNLDNNRSVIVVINDRGPFVYGRIIDLSKGAAREIGINGTQKVLLTILS